MQCPRCGVDNRQGRKFCSKCGARLENVCPKCGFRNEIDDTFCGGCGAKLGEAAPVKAEAGAPTLEDATHSRRTGYQTN